MAPRRSNPPPFPFFSHVQALLTWRDRSASAILVAACLAAMGLVQALGLSTVMCAGLLWQVGTWGMGGGGEVNI